MYFDSYIYIVKSCSSLSSDWVFRSSVVAKEVFPRTFFFEENLHRSLQTDFFEIPQQNIAQRHCRNLKSPIYFLTSFSLKYLISNYLNNYYIYLVLFQRNLLNNCPLRTLSSPRRHWLPCTVRNWLLLNFATADEPRLGTSFRSEDLKPKLQ